MKSKTNSLLTLVFLLVTYFLQAFFKISATIVMPVFKANLNLSAAMVGMISGLFFLSYAAMQILTGPLCRRFGVRLVCGFSLLVAAFGTFCFSIANNAWLLCLGRFLMGIGFGPAFISVLFFIQDSFPIEMYGKISGFSVMICNLGGVCASAPLKAMLDNFGITKTYTFFALLLLFFALFFFFLFALRDKTVAYSSSKEGIFHQIGDSLAIIFHSKRMKAVFLLWLFYNAILMSYQGLWNTSWTMVAFPENAHLAGLAVSFLGGGIMAGCLASDYIRNKKIIRGKTVSNQSFINLGLLLLLPVSRLFIPSIIFAIALDTVYGFFIGLMCVQITAFVREETDISHNSNIMGILNCSSSIGSQALQWLSGALIDLFALKTVANWSFGLTYFLLAASFCIPVAYALRLRRLDKKC